MSDSTLHEIAYEYVRRLNTGDVLNNPVDELFQSMLSGFGETETELAIKQMSAVQELLTPSNITQIKWYHGIVVKAPSLMSFIKGELIP